MQKILRALWDDLRARGGVDDVEAFIDGTYVPSKKGGTSSVDAGPVLRPSSWQWQTAMVFHSLSILPLEIEVKRNSSKKPFKPLSLSDSRKNLSETKLTTALRLFANSKNNEL
jgi:hypothetical protein